MIEGWITDEKPGYKGIIFMRNLKLYWNVCLNFVFKRWSDSRTSPLNLKVKRGIDFNSSEEIDYKPRKGNQLIKR